MNQQRSPLVFVYGTLKRGYWNHHPYMDGLTLIDEQAQTAGRIRLRRALTPILDVTGCGARIRQVGTSNLGQDLAQAQTAIPLTPEQASEGVDAWVSGELYALESPLKNPCKSIEQLAYIDALEDFLPREARSSLYERVLVPVLGSMPETRSVWAWIYRIPNFKDPELYPLAQNPSCWRGEVELPMDYFEARQAGLTPSPLHFLASKTPANQTAAKPNNAG